MLALALALGGCSVGPRYQRPPVALPDRWGAETEPQAPATAPAGQASPGAEPVPPPPAPGAEPVAPPPAPAAQPPGPTPAPEAAATIPSEPPSTVTPEEPDTDWWKVFGDPTLDHLIELAGQQNLTVQAAGLRIAEARAQLGIAVGSQFPQSQGLFAQATAIGISGDTPLGNVIDRRFVDYQAGFDASWEIDVWGKYRRGVEAANEDALASTSQYDLARVSVTAETARVYTMIRTYEALIRLALDNTRIQEEGLQIAESRLRNGATSELDVAQQKTLLESTRATVPQLQIGLEQSKNALGVLLGRPPGDLDDLLAGPEEIPTAPTTVAVGIPADLLRRRPDVLAAEHEAAAQSARVGIARTELYPALALTGTIGLDAAGGAGVEFDPGKSLFYNAGPAITLPFLDYGRTRNGVRVEDARYQQLLVGYQDTVLRAEQEVQDALTALDRSQRAAVYQAASVGDAQQALEIAMVQYREGAVDFQRVLDAQRALLDQENALTHTRSDVVTSLVALYKALGGGWEVGDDHPVVAPGSRP